MDEERRSLRTTFDSVAGNYHDARPRYPDELFDALDELVGAGGPLDALEVGCGTGIATEPMARRGHRVVALELGADLAEVARATLSGFDGVTVVNESFEDWEPPGWGSFDLVASATAWHWTDPARRYALAHRHLRDGGSLAFWSAVHVVPVGGDPFFADIQYVYDEIGEGLQEDHAFQRPGELATDVEHIEAAGLFDVVGTVQFDWETTYDADGYIALLDTFSGHISMEPWQRERLYGAIHERLSERDDGVLRRHWGTVLHVARRR